MDSLTTIENTIPEKILFATELGYAFTVEILLFVITIFQENVAHGYCLFLQDNKTPVKGGQIFDLLNALIDHGCKGCGSVPVDWENSNDPSVNGILTVNYVGATGCEGLC